jgi:nucleobase:cation symporter-1, NCS1 family
MGRLPPKQAIRARYCSLSAWELPKELSGLAPEYVSSNKDMDPVKPEDQTWSVWMWMAYWGTECISLGTWQTAGSMISAGLSWREAIPAVSAQYLYLWEHCMDQILAYLQQSLADNPSR